MRLQFRLATVLYVLTVACIELAVDRATAFTPYNDRAGGAVIWGGIFLWLIFRHVRSSLESKVEMKRRRQQMALRPFLPAEQWLP